MCVLAASVVTHGNTVFARGAIHRLTRIPVRESGVVQEDGEHLCVDSTHTRATHGEVMDDGCGK